MAGFLFCFLSVPIFVVGLIVKLTSRGPALYWSVRVGVGKEIFKMPKFRTMRRKRIRCHPLKGPCQEEKPILGKKKLFS